MNKRASDFTTPAGVGLVQKTLQILDLFQNDTPKWTQARIAESTGFPRSTVNRLVRFLTDRGYLAQADGQSHYSLGPSAIDLGRRASAQFDFRGICRPVLERLSVQTGETVILTSVVGTGNAVRCVDQIESTHEGLRVFEQVGTVFPLHTGASPKAVLATLPQDELENYLSRPLTELGTQQPIDKTALRKDIAKTVRRGYAVSVGETYVGVTGIGAPFFWSGHRPAGSLAVALPDHRASSKTIARIGAYLSEGAADITALLTGTTEPSPEETT
ncbi:MAG: IclR family transcriptional regulator [Silicimonas sp.]|nr:IclR family transcriptional regulator [Silicimonas sp.]